MIQTEQIRGELPGLKDMLREAEESLRPEQLKEERAALDEKINVPDFWNDP